jgi:hypothetical protein
MGDEAVRAEERKAVVEDLDLFDRHVRGAAEGAFVVPGENELEPSSHRVGGVTDEHAKDSQGYGLEPA